MLKIKGPQNFLDEQSKYLFLKYAGLYEPMYIWKSSESALIVSHPHSIRSGKHIAHLVHSTNESLLQFQISLTGLKQKQLPSYYHYYRLSFHQKLEESSQERREDKRFQFELPPFIHFSCLGKEVQACMVDVSFSGMKLMLYDPLPLHQLFSFHIRIPFFNGKEFGLMTDGISVYKSWDERLKRHYIGIRFVRPEGVPKKLYKENVRRFLQLIQENYPLKNNHF